jgi:hypothetical protein
VTVRMQKRNGRIYNIRFSFEAPDVYPKAVT